MENVDGARDRDDGLLQVTALARAWVIGRPDAFRKIAQLDDEALDEVLKEIERK